jgi:hypothetical protein
LGKFYESVFDALELYVRQSAWLSAVPDDRAKPAANVRPVSRRETLKKENQNIEMPPIECAAHLVTALWEIGPAMSTGMGNAPITWGEIESWERKTGTTLAPWEAKILRRLSISYIVELQSAAASNWPAPYGDAKIGRHVRKSKMQANLDLFLK